MKVAFFGYAAAALSLASQNVKGFQAAIVHRTSLTPTSLNLFSFGKKDNAVEEKVEEVEPRKGAFWQKASKGTAPVAVTVVEEEDESWNDFGQSPVTYAYAASWAGLMVFAFLLAPGELSSASDFAMIQSVIDNPAAPDMNPFYYGIFNLFAILPITLACTIAPRASEKGIPAGPPLFLSTFIAYFVMGPFLALRKTPITKITSSEQLSWLTTNVWENKIFNYFTVAFGLLCLAAGASGLEDLQASWSGLIDLIGSSRFASVSLADLSLITLILTKEVADDYKIRCDPENSGKAPFVGASTALLPILGAAIYCAVRPTLDLESEEA